MSSLFHILATVDLMSLYTLQTVASPSTEPSLSDTTVALHLSLSTWSHVHLKYALHLNSVAKSDDFIVRLLQSNMRIDFFQAVHAILSIILLSTSHQLNFIIQFYFLLLLHSLVMKFHQSLL
jgi:hypothetical protein